MGELDDFHADRTNILFTIMEAKGEDWDHEANINFCYMVFSAEMFLL